MGDFVDELSVLRNAFYLGAYDTVTSTIQPPSGDKTDPERSALYYRALIASGNPKRATSEIPPSAPAELQAVKLLAAHVIATAGKDSASKARAVAGLSDLLADGMDGLSSTVQAVAAGVFYQEGRYGEALAAAVKSPRNLECVALAIQCYLKLDRIDLARKEVEKLKTWADDATIAQLAEAWVGCFQGGEQNVMDAQYIFEELASSKVPTGRSVTGLAVCKMQAGKFPEAERILLEGLSRYPADSDLIANLIVCSNALGKPAEEVTRAIEKLREVAPGHPLLEDLVLKESLFERAAQRYTK